MGGRGGIAGGAAGQCGCATINLYFGWLCSLLGTLGGILGWEILYLGRNDILDTHLGCFCAPAGAGAGWRAFDNG